MKTGKTRKFLITIHALAGLLFFTSFAYGQIELSSGIDINYPLLLNKDNTKISYGQLTFGFNIGVAYKPPETQFFPVLKSSFGRTRLPIKQFGQNVAVINCDYINEMLNENIILRFTNSQLFIYGGIGFSYIKNRGLKVAGPGGETMDSYIDSTANINKVFPAMNIGFEYNSGVSVDKELYLTMGINFQYILLLQDRNSYFITVKQQGAFNKYSGSLTGGVISPGVYIAIHYLLHLKKKHSFYM
jgi:hypothetical protein